MVTIRRAVATARGRWWSCQAFVSAALVFGCGATQYERAVAEGYRSDRPLVVMATASWCGPCSYFKKHVLPTDEVQAVLADVRFVMLDEARDRDRLRRLGVRAFPTFLVVTPEQKPVAALRGAVSASKFVDFLKWGTPLWFSEDALTTQLEADPGQRTLLYAARFFALGGDLERSRALYRQAFDATVGRSQQATLAWEMVLVGNVGSPVGAVTRRAMAFIGTYAEAAEVRDAAEFVLLSGVLGEAEAQAVADKTLEAFWDRPATLNDLVYTFLAAERRGQALRAARRQVALRPDDANAYDTLGEALSAMGQRDEALAAADTAIRMEAASDSRATYKANRERFETGGPSKTVAWQRERFDLLLRRYRITR
jgi:thioredoxin-like negative regulator of GroEL